MDDITRRRALSGELGPDAQQLVLAQIADQVAPEASLLTPRQKRVAIIVAVLLVASMIALAAIRLSAPASLARRAVGS
jgi:hypothetical protein